MRFFRATQFLFALLFITSSYSQDISYAAFTIASEFKENANAVVRLSQKNITIVSQNSMFITEKRVITVLNEYGISNINALEYYDKNRKIKKVEVSFYDALGKKIKTVKRKDFKDASVGDGFSVFTDNRMLFYDYTAINYPFTAVYESEVETSNTAFIPSWSPVDDYYVGSENTLLTISFPKELGFKDKVANFSDRYPIIRSNNENSITYRAENVKAIKWEENCPGFLDVVPIVYFKVEKFNLEGVNGVAENWKDFGKWFYESLLVNTDELPLETIEKVKNLIGAEKDTRKIAKIIYKYVQDKTRYVSVQVGIGGFKPMLAKDVDRLGYGDCKALVNYTRALLNAVNVPSYYTIVQAGSNKRGLQEDFASVQGNHIILAVPYEQELIWLECTNQLLPFGFQGDFTDDRNVVMIKPDGGEMVRTSLFANKDNSQFTKGNYVISSTGELSGSLSIVSKGIQYDNSYAYERLSTDDKDKHYKSYFGAMNNLKINALAFNNDAENIAFTQNIKLSANAYADANNNKLIFVLNAFNNFSKTPKRYRSRENAFEISRGYYDHDEIDILVPDNYRVEAVPENNSIKNKFGEYSFEIISQGKNSFTYKRILFIKEGFYESTDYDEYRLFKEQIVRNDNAKIILNKKS